MKKLALLIVLLILSAGCGHEKPMKYSPGATYAGVTYRLIVLGYSDQKDMLGAAVLDLEGDGMTYTPHPDEEHVQIFEGLSFPDASEKTHDILGRHCGVFTYTTRLLADPDNILIGYEITPVIKETAYCIIGDPVSVNYHGPDNGTITISLPERETLPFTPGVEILR